MKRLLKVIAAIVLAACSAVAFAACEEPAAHVHNFTGEYVSAEGGHAKTCAAEGCTAVDQNIEEHEWAADADKPAIEATCHSDGTKYYKCTVCGEEKTEAQTNRPAHSFTGEYVSAEGGHAKTCAAEGCTAVDQNIEEHEWAADADKPAIEATCHSDGTKYYKCTVCGEEKTEAQTNRPAHSFTGGYVAAEGGHAKTCAAEGCTAVDEIQPHEWDEGVITSKPTLFYAGLKTFTCNDCGTNKTEEISAKNSTTYKEDFNLAQDANGNQVGDWQYGTVDYKFQSPEDFDFTQFSAFTNGNDGWEDGGCEIKDEFINVHGKWVAVAFTFSEDVTANIDFSFISNQADSAENLPKFNCRIGVKDENGIVKENPHFIGGDNGISDCSHKGDKTFKKGDTVYFMIEHKGGWESGSLNITITKIAE